MISSGDITFLRYSYICIQFAYTFFFVTYSFFWFLRKNLVNKLRKISKSYFFDKNIYLFLVQWRKTNIIRYSWFEVKWRKTESEFIKSLHLSTRPTKQTHHISMWSCTVSVHHITIYYATILYERNIIKELIFNPFFTTNL